MKAFQLGIVKAKIKVSARLIKDLLFADVAAVVARREQEIQHLSCSLQFSVENIAL